MRGPVGVGSSCRFSISISGAVVLMASSPTIPLERRLQLGQAGGGEPTEILVEFSHFSKPDGKRDEHVTLA
jgi:hypothetical protein